MLFDRKKAKLVELCLDRKVIDLVSSRRFLSFVSSFLQVQQPDNQPIFIIGAPRSGTSILYLTLSQNAQLSSLKRELDIFWHQFTDGKSDALDENAADEKTRKTANAFFRIVSRGKPFLDKTVSNSLKIRFLHKIFPEAKFVFIFRRGEDSVNSLINGWRLDRFVPAWFKQHSELCNWHFTLIPNWRSLVGKPVPVICANQWVYCNSQILKDIKRIPKQNRFEVKYEDFVENSLEVTAAILRFLGVLMDEKTRKYALELKPLPLDSNVVTLPHRGKWKQENRQAIESVMHLIRPMNKMLGYAKN